MTKAGSVFALTFILSWTTISYSQGSIAFGVKQGPDNSSAYVGIFHERFVPSIGADLFWLTATGGFEDTKETITSTGGIAQRHLELLSLDVSGRALLVVPNIGAKYFLNSKLARPYLFGCVFLALPSVNLDQDGYRETWEYQDDRLIDYQKEKAIYDIDEIEKTLTEVLSFWGFRFGAGAEYFFDPHFSVGGEYGFSVIFDQADYAQMNPDYDNSYPSDQFLHKWQADVSASLKLSYALISLNYYF